MQKADAPVFAAGAEKPALARAVQLGERIDVRGLEREDAFSKNPLGLACGAAGAAVVFRSGAVALFNLTAQEEASFLDGLAARVERPIAAREIEAALISLDPAAEEGVDASGALRLKRLDPERLLLLAEALAMSASLSWSEARIARVVEGAAPFAESLRRRRLPRQRRRDMLAQIGEGLSIEQRLAGRADLDAKPDVLWDHPELERLWTRLVDEYDLVARSRAVERRLAAIRQSSETIADLLATRTSHRLEWYIIALIAFEVLLGLYDRFVAG